MALIDDIATQMGTSTADLSETQRQRLVLAIADAQALITDHFPGQALDSERVDRVIRWAVAEWATLPASGVVSTEVGIDDTRTATRWQTNAAQSLESVLAKWWDHLAPENRRPTASFSVQPSYQPDLRGDRERL